MDKIYLNYCSGSRGVKQLHKHFYAVLTFLFLFVGTSYAQSIKITGTVKDKQGELLPGVSVKIKGTAKGTITSSNGTYSINVTDENSVLVFSYLGFVPQEKPLTGTTVIDVVLAAQSSSKEFKKDSEKHQVSLYLEI